MSVPWGLTTVIARRASFIIKLLIGIGMGHTVQGKNMGWLGGLTTIQQAVSQHIFLSLHIRCDASHP